ncbi:MAG TPA: hypothetical protein VN944_10645 [Nitrospiria bacterium]|nr:hypothetical protein [Nitrospiria bacterium]
MGEESLQEVHLLRKDHKTRSLINSLYNIYYYGMESLLLTREIHSRNHQQLKDNFISKVVKNDPSMPSSLEEEIAAVYQLKSGNDAGETFPVSEIDRWVEKGENFLALIKKKILV